MAATVGKKHRERERELGLLATKLKSSFISPVRNNMHKSGCNQKMAKHPLTTPHDFEQTPTGSHQQKATFLSPAVGVRDPTKSHSPARARSHSIQKKRLDVVSKYWSSLSKRQSNSSGFNPSVTKRNK